MSRDISVYIKDILQNMRDAEEFIQGFSYDQFASDKKTPDEIRAKYFSVPWKEMAGLRDKIIRF